MKQGCYDIRRLLAIMAKLRDPTDGCPWDIEQTFSSIAPYTIEEAYEVADAIENGDMALLKEEIGDLLLQVIFYAQIAQEQCLFTFSDIVVGLTNKLIRRHPHVFGDGKVHSAEEQLLVWETIKAAERQQRDITTPSDSSVFDGIAIALPALIRASKLGIRAASVGFDWPSAALVIDEIEKETAALRVITAIPIEEGADLEQLESKIGDLLLNCAGLARKVLVDPETALRKANDKFERRFRQLESLLPSSLTTDISLIVAI